MNIPKKFIDSVNNAIFYDGLPEDALNWDFYEVLTTTRGIGSGESRTWQSWLTVRKNGKQLWSQRKDEYSMEEMREIISGATHVDCTKNGDLYVKKP